MENKKYYLLYFLAYARQYFKLLREYENSSSGQNICNYCPFNKELLNKEFLNIDYNLPRCMNIYTKYFGLKEPACQSRQLEEFLKTKLKEPPDEIFR